MSRDSPVVLREPQQRRPLCLVGWVGSPSEDINRAEIVPGKEHAMEYGELKNKKSKKGHK